VWPLLSGQPGARSPHEAFFYFWGRELQAIRSGPWKLHLEHSYRTVTAPGTGGRPGQGTARTIGVELYDLSRDPGESTDVAAAHPEVVARLRALAERAPRP
jgi:arylsulfatase A